MRTPMLCIFCMHFTAIFSQWNDDFSSKTLVNWSGDTSHFTINAEHQLMLNAQSAGRSFIYRDIQPLDSFMWRFYIQLKFAPSTNNLLRIYLLMDSTDSNLAAAYFIEIGENGNNDTWKFIRRKNGQLHLLSMGTMATLSKDPAICRFQITRSSDKTYQVFTDYTGNSNFSLESEFMDTIDMKFTAYYFGIECIYTDTRKDKFIFDEFEVGIPPADTVPPQLSNLDVLNHQSLKIKFNELVDSSSVLNSNHFTINGGERPVAVQMLDFRKSEYLLSFANSFLKGIPYELEILNISDLNRNILVSNIYPFFYNPVINAQKNDILICEIMADPAPSAGLPESEFIELINISNETLSIKSYTLSDGSSQIIFPGYTLNPLEPIILCHHDDSILFKKFGKVLSFSSFPSLNNSGDQIYIQDTAGNVIHFIHFTADWHTSDTKKDGGYTLEMINPFQVCSGAENWATSNHVQGGTPGQINSNWNPQIDTSGPQLIEIIALSEWEIKLVFNESLDDKAQLTANYIITPTLSIATAELSLPNRKEVILLLNHKINVGIIYELSINTIQDCVGNLIPNSKGAFSLPDVASYGELVWNEVLFNPESGGVDFIEIYNRSEKLLSTQGLYFSNPSWDSIWIPVKIDKLLAPHTYTAFTTNPTDILGRYFVSDSNRLLKNVIPSLDDAGGSLYLGNLKLNKIQILDSFTFSKSWHSPFLSESEGISLERIQTNGLSSSQGNWHSASSTVGYATPGRKNSQNLVVDSLSQDKFYTLSSRIVSPNQDGDKDFLAITIKTDKPGYKIHCQIFDLSARKIKDLTQQLLGTTDLLIWDTYKDNGSLAVNGNYIIHLMLVHESGVKKMQKDYFTIHK
ncbi:MAG: lamin tail domain-containing protein [Bacteroidota bacterium]|nr:lamin tail domain-containing protein [Bacteroidota bacterium]